MYRKYTFNLLFYQISSLIKFLEQKTMNDPMTARSTGGALVRDDGMNQPQSHPIMSRAPTRDLHGAPNNVRSALHLLAFLNTTTRLNIAKVQILTVFLICFSTNRRSRSLSRSFLRTGYNEKAREGFKFWDQERPPPTSCKFSFFIKNNLF